MCCSQAKVEVRGKKQRRRAARGMQQQNYLSLDFLQGSDRAAKNDNLIAGMTFCLKTW